MLVSKSLLYYRVQQLWKTGNFESPRTKKFMNQTKHWIVYLPHWTLLVSYNLSCLLFYKMTRMSLMSMTRQKFISNLLATVSVTYSPSTVDRTVAGTGWASFGWISSSRWKVDWERRDCRAPNVCRPDWGLIADWVWGFCTMPLVVTVRVH